MERNEGFVAAAGELQRGRARYRDAQALRNVRRDRALQLPVGAHDGDDRGRADRRQHRDRQALRGDAVDGRAARRSDAGGGAADGRLQPRARRAGDRPRAGRRRRSTGSPSPVRPRSDARSRSDSPQGPYARPALTEMGGKNPAIVTTSADLDSAAEGSLGRPSGSPGRSAAPARAPSSWTPSTTRSSSGCAHSPRPSPSGIPSEREAFLGPVINERAHGRFRGGVRAARSDGRIAIGGGLPRAGGWFVEPTIVHGLPRGHPLTRARAVPAVAHRHPGCHLG